MQGSFIPFAVSRSERDQSGDPRRSVEERYQSRGQFLARIFQAGTALVGQRYLLEADVQRIVDQAGTRWNLVAGRAGSQ